MPKACLKGPQFRHSVHFELHTFELDVSFGVLSSLSNNDPNKALWSGLSLLTLLAVFFCALPVIAFAIIRSVLRFRALLPFIFHSPGHSAVSLCPPFVTWRWTISAFRLRPRFLSRFSWSKDKRAHSNKDAFTGPFDRQQHNFAINPSTHHHYYYYFLLLSLFWVIIFFSCAFIRFQINYQAWGNF